MNHRGRNSLCLGTNHLVADISIASILATRKDGHFKSFIDLGMGVGAHMHGMIL